VYGTGAGAAAAIVAMKRKSNVERGAERIMAGK